MALVCYLLEMVVGELLLFGVLAFGVISAFLIVSLLVDWKT